MTARQDQATEVRRLLQRPFRVANEVAIASQALLSALVAGIRPPLRSHLVEVLGHLVGAVDNLAGVGALAKRRRG